MGGGKIENVSYEICQKHCQGCLGCHIIGEVTARSWQQVSKTQVFLPDLDPLISDDFMGENVEDFG